MSDPLGLNLSYAAAADKLAAGLWLTQVAVIALRRGRTVPAWQIVLAILTFAASAIAWRSYHSTGWLIAGGLALLMLIDGLRLWMTEPASGQTSPGSAKPGLALPALSLAVVGSGLCSWAVVQAAEGARIAGQPHVIMLLSQVSLFIIFAMLLSSTMELTFGSFGTELLALPWKEFATVATFVFLLEILLAGWVITKLQPHESVEMTAAPVLYEFSRLLLCYIAWCLPRRMVILSQKKEIRGQPSLALSGWVAVICFAVAMALPTAWPWNMLKL